MVTIHDVARAAGVSTATVSRSFASASHSLSDGTRKRVLDAAEKLGYKPRRRSSASAGSSRPEFAGVVSIGFQFFACNPADTLTTNAFYGPVLSGAQSESDALGMHILLNTTHRHRLSLGLPSMIREQAVDGMLLVGTADPDILQSFLRYVPQIVLLDNRDVTQQHDCVISDGFGGAMMATERLFALGHRRIGFLTCQAPEVTFEDRMYGYICAHHKVGVLPDHDLIFAVGATDNDGDIFIATEEIVTYLREAEAVGRRPTAFVAANDAHALALIHACRQLGISMPHEISVIGFDDVEFAAHVYPPLTTVRVDKEEMGRLAVKRLRLRMDEIGQRRKPDQPIVIQVPVALVERESCAPPCTAKR